jgi:4-alpha-glucanotransferase
VTTLVRSRVREGLALLGVRRLLLGIHDAAFPSAPAEDVGRGAPASDGAADFLALASSLGFDGLQLGPQGTTSRDDPSPYLGTLFSRNPLSIALAPLTRPEWGELLRPEALARAVAERPGPAERAVHAYARDAIRAALVEIVGAFRRRRSEGAAGEVERLHRELVAFRAAHGDWLERDALHAVLTREHGGGSWRGWGGERGELDRRLWAPAPGEERQAGERRSALLDRHAEEVEAYALVQWIAHRQHREMRARARALGLDLFGDLQAGMSDRDAWTAQAFVLRGWLMGAPPSRTNPDGQPWGYPVLDPARYFEAHGEGRHDGPAVRFLRARARKAYAEYDGLRIDHPHALVCPWVYRDGGDPLLAVRHGARLFSSPGLQDAPELAAFAIAREDQLDRAERRHADGWVKALSDEQVERYAVLVDVIMQEARAARRSAEDVACEILSTQPYPVGRVLARYGLGRFRVTQKADLSRADDVYRSENAHPEDWIMLGNHDTRPIWLLAEEWLARGSARAQAEYLASRLLAPGEPREPWIQRVASDVGELAQARFADLFVGPARHVMVFFADLLGAREVYNEPGTLSPDNWALRVPRDFRAVYRARLAARRALDVPRAVARALRQRGAEFVAAHRALIEELERAAV